MSNPVDHDPTLVRTPVRSHAKAWTFALGLLMSACLGAPPQEDGDLPSSDETLDDDTEDKLFSAGGSSAIWDRHIHYCFLRPASQHVSIWQKRKADFAAVMNRTWNAVGVIQLISDGDCPANPGRYVVTVRYDYPGDGWSNARLGMRSTVNNTSGPDVNISVGFLTGKVSGHDGNVAHEMGHILGFDHEKDRTNSCNENAVSKDNDPGAIYWTSNDPRSIMNFSYCSTSNGLTEKDKQGLRKAYAHLGGEDLCPSDPNKRAPGQCGCGKREPYDVSAYRDAQGYPCSDWQGYSCARASEEYGYTAAQEASIIASCSQSCGVCPTK